VPPVPDVAAIGINVARVFVEQVNPFARFELSEGPEARGDEIPEPDIAAEVLIVEHVILLAEAVAVEAFGDGDVLDVLELAGDFLDLVVHGCGEVVDVFAEGVAQLRLVSSWAGAERGVVAQLVIFEVEEVGVAGHVQGESFAGLAAEVLSMSSIVSVRSRPRVAPCSPSLGPVI
jgi:hypothetical protein